MRTIESDFKAGFKYRAFFTDDVFAESNPLLGKLLNASPKVFFLYEQNLEVLFPGMKDRMKNYCDFHKIAFVEPLALPGGESCKNFEFVLKLCEILLNVKICRHSCVIAVGGGAFLDAVGLACALFHRGVRHIRIPTTALSQCDSGVGVKNGINAFGRKNLLGTFAPPFAVVEDGVFLDTLPKRERISASAEAVKVAMIKDASFFEYLEDNAKAIADGDNAKLRILVHRSAELHIRHIADGGDPFENGEARPLDFGHWAAHRMETISNGMIRHGEAVADGMRIDTRYAVLAGIAKQSVADRLDRVLDSLGLAVHKDLLTVRTPDGTRSVLTGLEEFREHLGGCLHITLPKEVGRKVEVTEMDPVLLEKAIRSLTGETDE